MPIRYSNTKHFFVPNHDQEPAFARPFGNGPVGVGTLSDTQPFLVSSRNVPPRGEALRDDTKNACIAD